jgi:Skp family chaperone for outer membrane proteins
MKKVALSIMALIAIMFSAGAQQTGEKSTKSVNVPAAVAAAFAKQYAGVTPKWEKEDGDYEASFEQHDKETSVVYTAAGQLKETEVEIAVNELPAAATAYLAKNHPNAKVKEAAKITAANGVVTYEAEVKDKDLLFDVNGNFIK